MIINDVMIENFRCYYGENELHLNNEGKITLIYGDSGYGKSSLLQFFNWMFYDNPDFGSNNDKPIFNLTAYEESAPSKQIKVSGKIDFEHLGVKYSLSKTRIYSYALDPLKARVDGQDYSLLHLVEDNWEKYSGDVANKINTILPKGLSKYFLLDGEKARDIVLNSKDLKVAIHQLFGLDAYANALSHIGNKNKKRSVLGTYYSEMTSKMTGSSGDEMSVAEMQENIQELYEIIEAIKEKRKECMAEIETKSARKDEIIKFFGQADNKDSINQLIKMNSDAIELNENQIKNLRHMIGDLFYRNYPYLFLAKLACNSSSILKDKNEEYGKLYRNVFEYLEKDLLKEILEKNTCVCGRLLDDASREKIDGIIHTMLPCSYTHEFSKFISKSKRYIREAQINIIDYGKYLSETAICEKKISELEDSNRKKIAELGRLNNDRELVEECEQITKDLEKLGHVKSEYEEKITKKKLISEAVEKKLNQILKDSKISNEFTEKINFFEEVREMLESEKEAKEIEVKETLNSCVKEIFKKLTTQNELDVDTIQFVNDDFSLRTTYLTGGQLAVDEYSYVIGIIKALQECKMENNENPIIIDAPFAFTGNTQSEHIFKTLPEVSKQTILLTHDLNKIKNLLHDTQLYDFYVIANETQERATIKRGNVNDIKF